MKILDTAENILLVPAGITESQLQYILANTITSQVDSADIYLQSCQTESWVLENAIVKRGSFSIEKGVGIRAISGETTGFAFSNDIALPALEQAAKAARSIVAQGTSGVLQVPQAITPPVLYPTNNPLDTLSEIQKIALLQTIDKEARSQDPRVIHVNAVLSGEYEIVLILNSDGSIGADIRPMVRLDITVIVEKNGQRESGYAGGGGRKNYQCFFENNLALNFTKEAVRQALVNLEAKPAPAGHFPVILGPGWPAVLLHEAIGHGLEGDFNRKGSSAFSGRIGERVATAACTIVDDATLPKRRGSLSIDDEGTPAQCTVLIENGILKNYMQDKLNAKLMGTKSTGNGRRESYASQPIPRMTNTYMLPGNYSPDEIIASVDKGIYAVNFSGGQVDITSGKFVFSMCEAYLIENGKISYPIKGATLIGNGPDVLTKVSMVGNNLKLDSGIGVCGKDGQSIPVGVGQPTLKVDSIIVGGTQA